MSLRPECGSRRGLRAYASPGGSSSRDDKGSALALSGTLRHHMGSLGRELPPSLPGFEQISVLRLDAPPEGSHRVQDGRGPPTPAPPVGLHLLVSREASGAVPLDVVPEGGTRLESRKAAVDAVRVGGV